MTIANFSKASITRQDGEDINSLLRQLSGRIWNYDYLAIRRLLRQKRLITMVALNDDRRIIGMAFLKIDSTKMLTRNFVAGFVGDVVVDKDYRGQGIATALMNELLRVARFYNVSHISLTSNPNNPERALAIRMYEGMGFKKIGELDGSNYYRLTMKNQ